MANLRIKTPSLQRELKSWAGIIFGSFITAVGFVLFINPYSIIPGGVYGLSIMLHNLFPFIQVGTFGYVFEVPLLVLALVFLGKGIGLRTIVASLITPLMMNTLSSLIYPTQEALQALDPTQMLGGNLDLSNQLILAVIMGPLCIGIGAGVVVKSGASGGGTDIVAMFMQKYMGVRFSNALLIADGVVVLAGLVVNSFLVGGDSLMLSFYSLIAIYVASRVVARVINGPQDDKMIWVVTNEEAMPELRRFILEDMDRTATYFKASGLYSQSGKEILMLVVHYKDVARIKVALKEFDPKAFVIVSDACDAYGEGWKDLPSFGEFTPE